MPWSGEVAMHDWESKDMLASNTTEGINRPTGNPIVVEDGPKISFL